MTLRNITAKTCCWTIPIRLGAFFLGIVGLLLCALELAVLLPYDFGFDIAGTPEVERPVSRQMTLTEFGTVFISPHTLTLEDF